MWGLVTQDTEEVEVPNASFAIVFTGKTGLLPLQAPQSREKVWSSEDIPLLEEDYSAEYLCELEYLNPQAVMVWCTKRCWGSWQMPLWGSLLSIFEQSWWLCEMPEDWSKANFTPILKTGK